LFSLSNYWYKRIGFLPLIWDYNYLFVLAVLCSGCSIWHNNNISNNNEYNNNNIKSNNDNNNK